MKKLIFRKFYQDITYFFLTALMVSGLIVWTIQAVNYFDFVTEDGHGLKVYFYYSLLNFPKIIERIYIFIFFVAIFYIIITYEAKNEMVIFWVNGIKKIKFINKLLFFSCMIMIFQIILSVYIVPFSKLKARSYIKNSDVNFFTSLIKAGKFINVTKGLTIFIDKKEEDGTLKNIFLEDVKENDSKMIYANKGFIFDDSKIKILKLYDGRVINIEKTKINLFDFDEINFSLNELNSKSITVPKIQEIDTKILLSCFFEIKNEKFELFKCNERMLKEVKTELIKRLFKPIYIPLIVLLTCFLIIISKNNKNYKKYLYFVFIINFLILVLSEISIKYAVISSSHMIFYFFIPFILFIVSYFLLYKFTKNV